MYDDYAGPTHGIGSALAALHVTESAAEKRKEGLQAAYIAAQATRRAAAARARKEALLRANKYQAAQEAARKEQMEAKKAAYAARIATQKEAEASAKEAEAAAQLQAAHSEGAEVLTSADVEWVMPAAQKGKQMKRQAEGLVHEAVQAAITQTAPKALNAGGKKFPRGRRPATIARVIDTLEGSQLLCVPRDHAQSVLSVLLPKIRSRKVRPDAAVRIMKRQVAKDYAAKRRAIPEGLRHFPDPRGLLLLKQLKLMQKRGMAVQGQAAILHQKGSSYADILAATQAELEKLKAQMAAMRADFAAKFAPALPGNAANEIMDAAEMEGALEFEAEEMPVLDEISVAVEAQENPDAVTEAVSDQQAADIIGEAAPTVMDAAPIVETGADTPPMTPEAAASVEAGQGADASPEQLLALADSGATTKQALDIVKHKTTGGGLSHLHPLLTQQNLLIGGALAGAFYLYGRQR
jgi:hypothetical protein